jgi:exodeoxyribonuclease VII large subunit
MDETPQGSGEAVERTLEVAEFYEQVTGLLERAFPKSRQTTIRGEIAKIYEKSHLYLDIVDAGSSSSDTRRPVLNAHCWISRWTGLKRDLDNQGIILKPGTVVKVTGYADLYTPQGKIGFTVTDINIEELVGDLARRRLALISELTTEHVLGEHRTNAQRPVSPVPLRIGIVASAATEGYADFVGQFNASPYNFALTLAHTVVQGEAAPSQIVNAIQSLDEAGLDVICVVRGGGSKGDLSCFDDERVARAIAAALTPVWTGIGHTNDVSIADMAAHTSVITPTKLGETLVGIVREWHTAHVLVPTQRLSERVAALLDQETAFVAERRRTMTFAVRDRLIGERRHLRTTGGRVVLHAEHVLTNATTKIASTRQLLAAYDPSRRLSQGWALVRSASGTLVRSVEDVTAGDSLQVVLGNGHLGVTVDAVERNL